MIVVKFYLYDCYVKFYIAFSMFSKVLKQNKWINLFRLWSKVWNFKNQRWRRPILNNKKSPYVGRDWSDLVEIWHSEAIWPYWRVRPFWKIQKLRYLDRGSSDFAKIWHNDVVLHSWPLKTLRNTNPRWRRPPSWKIEKSPYCRDSNS